MENHETPSGIDEIWTVEQVAQYLAMSVSWVYKQAELGKLPVLRMGGARGSLRFSSGYLKRFVHAQMRGAGSGGR